MSREEKTGDLIERLDGIPLPMSTYEVTMTSLMGDIALNIAAIADALEKKESAE